MGEKNKKIIFQVVLALLVVGIYWWSVKGADVSFSGFIKGLPYMFDFLERMFPPNLAILPTIIRAAEETVQIAIIGTTLATFAALPIGFLAAQNMTELPIIYLPFRIVSNICRGVSELVWALLFVAMVGLGPFPGVLALMVHSIGALSKFFAEAIENLHEETVLTVRSTGASRLQIIFQGIIPEVLPNFISYVLYYFEHNIRAATVLGIVGAGGIGFELLTSIKLFRYREVLTVVIVMLLIITIVDRFSALVRGKIIGVKKQ